jgi:hypothetical protein
MTDKEFIEIAKNTNTMALAAKLTKMSYSNFIRKAKKLGCYYPNQGGKGTHKPNITKIPLKDILEGKHPEYQTYKLKIRLIKEGIIEDKCSICDWDKKPEGNLVTPCELDHINGNPLDHRLENLRLICPNCHSLTKTYRFRKREK